MSPNANIKTITFCKIHTFLDDAANDFNLGLLTLMCSNTIYCNPNATLDTSHRATKNNKLGTTPCMNAGRQIVVELMRGIERLRKRGMGRRESYCLLHTSSLRFAPFF